MLSPMALLTSSAVSGQSWLLGPGVVVTTLGAVVTVLGVTATSVLRCPAVWTMTTPTAAIKTSATANATTRRPERARTGVSDRDTARGSGGRSGLTSRA